MMKMHVFRGSKQEIAESLVRLSGEVREVIVFEEDAALPVLGNSHLEDIFAEMRPFMVDVPDVDDSRAAIYTRPAVGGGPCGDPNSPRTRRASDRCTPKPV
jgi:hypothetical protein